jgi:hypothetical protein
MRWCAECPSLPPTPMPLFPDFSLYRGTTPPDSRPSPVRAFRPCPALPRGRPEPAGCDRHRHSRSPADTRWARSSRVLMRSRMNTQGCGWAEFIRPPGAASNRHRRHQIGYAVRRSPAAPAGGNSESTTLTRSTGSRAATDPGSPTPRWLLRAFTRFNVLVYRFSGGRLMNRLAGMPIVLVKMRGARSGKTRTIPLMCVPHGDDFILVASQGGAPKHPAWSQPDQQSGGGDHPGRPDDEKDREAGQRQGAGCALVHLRGILSTLRAVSTADGEKHSGLSL